MMLPSRTRSATHRFDVVVIGSGPAAVAALDGLASVSRVAVVTGAVPSAERRSTLHPKIQAVSLLRSEAAGVAERIAATGNPRPMFSTAAVGGLANYWGQQFVRWGEADPWPQDTFASFADYGRACDSVERLFAIEGGGPLSINSIGDGYRALTPRLLSGSAEDGAAGLGAMRRAFASRAAAVRASVFPRRADSIARVGADWVVRLDDGTSLSAERVLLGAGVVGDGQILLRSFPDLSGFAFSDHTPWLLFTVGAKRLFPYDHSGSKPFNALTIYGESASGCDLFSSFYDMRGGDLNLLLASTLGRAHPWLRRWRTPPGTGLVTPVQVWTPKTYGRVEIAASNGALTFASDARAATPSDPNFERFRAWLRSAGVRILRSKRTDPVAGYHYHRLQLKQRNGWAELADFLQQRTGNGVACIDAADLPHIGCQPHTLTVMARAWSRAADAASGLPAEAIRKS